MLSSYSFVLYQFRDMRKKNGYTSRPNPRKKNDLKPIDDKIKNYYYNFIKLANPFFLGLCSSARYQIDKTRVLVLNGVFI